MTDRTDNQTCVVCGMTDNVVQSFEDRTQPLVSHIDCPRCGPYNLALMALPPIPENQERMHLLAGVIRSYKEKQEKCFIVDSTVLQAVEGFNDKIMPLAPKDDNAKMMLILQYVGRKAASGDSVSLDPNMDYPIAFSKSPDEFQLLVRTLVQEDLLEDVSSQPKIRVILTVAGRQKIQALSRPPIGFKT